MPSCSVLRSTDVKALRGTAQACFGAAKQNVVI